MRRVPAETRKPARGYVVNNDRFALLEGLLGEAFARLGQATPTVVSVKPPEEGDETSASYAMPFSWPNRIVTSSDDIELAVSDQLAAGPVLLVPPWNRRQERRHPLSRDEHEIAVLNCVPDGPDSLLAVLTPTGMWSSLSSQQVREELAKRWKPVLLIYAAGVLPGVHSSFLLAVVFLRPREAEDSPVPRLPSASAPGRRRDHRGFPASAQARRRQHAVRLCPARPAAAGRFSVVRTSRSCLGGEKSRTHGHGKLHHHRRVVRLRALRDPCCTGSQVAAGNSNPGRF